MSIATRSSPSTITACALTAGHRVQFVQPADLCGPSRAVSDDHQFVILTRPNPEGRGCRLHSHRQQPRCSRAGQHVGERLRNRRSGCPIAQRPRRWKIGSQPPAIAMGRDAHRRGTAARESAERRRRAAMTMTSPYLSCHGCGITAGENENGCADIESVLERGWTHARDGKLLPDLR